MVYLEYENSTGHVIEIFDEEPQSLEDGHSLAQSDDFSVNDEFDYLITINSVDENQNVTSASSVRQARSYSKLLKENQELKRKSEDQQSAINFLLEV